MGWSESSFHTSFFFVLTIFNPNKPNGLFHSYTLGESFCHWRDFQFCSVFNWNFCKQTVKTLIRCHIMWHLIWVCTVCLCPTKVTPGLLGLKSENSTFFMPYEGSAKTLIRLQKNLYWCRFGLMVCVKVSPFVQLCCWKSKIIEWVDTEQPANSFCVYTFLELEDSIQWTEKIQSFSLNYGFINLYLSLGKFSWQQIDDIFLFFFFQKIGLDSSWKFQK